MSLAAHTMNSALSMSSVLARQEELLLGPSSTLLHAHAMIAVTSSNETITVFGRRLVVSIMQESNELIENKPVLCTVVSLCAFNILTQKERP